MGSHISFWMWVGPAVLLVIFGLFTWWGYPKAKVLGPETKPPFYWLYLLLKSVLVLAIVWILAALFVLGVAGAYYIDSNRGDWWEWLVGLSPVVLIGVLGAIFRSFRGETAGGVTSGEGSGLKTIIGSLLGIAGYLALGGLLVVAYYTLDTAFFPDPADRRPIPGGVFYMTIGSFAVATVMLFVSVSWFLNYFSLQPLYRRGLRRAYILRAARPEDVPQLRGSQVDVQQLRGKVVPRSPERLLLTELKRGDEPPDMPYHLIGAAVNTSGDTQLQRLGRRSDGFILAHLWSGSRVTGYKSTADSEALSDMALSEAMAISGAAQSPNMGRATTTSMAILMALFNIRIGSWIRHPNEAKWESASWRKPASWWRLVPLRPVVWYWLKELFGSASADDPYIYLTDGDHFDNSGIYELLKRRCKFILAVDASAGIGNLATVARLARIDLGVQIDIDLSSLKYGSPTELSERAFMVGRIKYPPVQGDSKPEGVLVWIPTVLTKGQKPDVVRYAEKDPLFPFNPTGDQFFDQVQLEAYRQLGYTAAGVAFPDKLVEDDPLTRHRLEQVFESLWGSTSARRQSSSLPGGHHTSKGYL